MKKIVAGMMVAALFSGTAFSENFVYQGNGADPNEWFDAATWSSAGGGATNWPTTADNALFVVGSKDMVISQVVPEHSQLQAGRGVPSMITIAAGGVVTNLNQTLSGVLNDGKGTLVIDGGSLVTKQMQISVAGGTGFVPDSSSSLQLKSGSVEVGLGGGLVLLGPNAPGTLEISGGSMDIGTELKFFDGYLNMVGTDGTLDVGTIFHWGMQAGKTTEINFVLGTDGHVSPITADSIAFAGTQSLVIDGTFAETDSEQSLVLIDLANDTFSGAELAALSGALELVNMESGSLSLSGNSKQLIFTGKPVPRYLAKAWEFNSIGDTEGWAATTGNTHLSNVTVAAAINGSETVLTCQDVSGIDPNLYYNQAQSAGSKIALNGDSWRTLVVRLRQLDANPDEVGVASKLFNPQGTIALIQSPVFNFLSMENENVLCDVELESDNWIVATYDISSFGVNDLASLRMDPIGDAVNTNFNFEIDYIRLYAGQTQPPVVRQLAQAWEFNSAGDAEGWYGDGMTGVTVSNTIDGSESVMTCADVTGIDPMSKYTNTVSVGGGEWDTLEFRARQLTGNPGDVGVTFTNWNINGTIVLVQGVNLGGLSDVGNVSITTDTNGWVLGVVDISSIGGDLNNLRFDFIGNNANGNFEVDYIRAYKYQRQTGYEYWASLYNLTGTNAAYGADPDNDLFTNFEEYSFGGDPTDDASTGVLPVGSSSQSGGSNVLEYVYFKNSSPYSGLTYALVGATGLVPVPSWTDVADYVETGTGSYNDWLDAVTNHIPAELEKRFIRTRVTGQ